MRATKPGVVAVLLILLAAFLITRDDLTSPFSDAAGAPIEATR